MGNKIALMGWLVAMGVLPATVAWAQGGVTAQDFVPDARSQGMGGAFTAVAEGPAANWWNPGALGLEQPISFSPYSAVQLVPDIADDIWLHTFGAIGHVPSRGVGFGAQLTHLSYGKSLATDSHGQVIGEVEPQENVILIGAGANLAEAIAEDSDRLRLGVGINFKVFNLSEFGLSPSGEPVNANSWDLDLGTLLAYRVPLGTGLGNGQARSPHIDFRGGLVMLNQLDRRISFNSSTVRDSEPLDRRLRIGGALELYLPPLPPLDRIDHLLRTIIAADQLSFHGEGNERTLGLEMSLLSLVAFRAGHASRSNERVSGLFSGWGVGTDLQVGEMSRVGGRVDFASAPQAPGLRKIKQYTVSGWVTF